MLAGLIFRRSAKGLTTARNCVPEVFCVAGWKLNGTARSASPFQPTWTPRVVPLADLPRLSTTRERPLRWDVRRSRRGRERRRGVAENRLEFGQKRGKTEGFSSEDTRPPTGCRVLGMCHPLRHPVCGSDDGSSVLGASLRVATVATPFPVGHVARSDRGLHRPLGRTCRR